MGTEILKPEEVAELLAVNKETIYRLARKDEIPHFHIGKLLRFSKDQIEDWLNVNIENH